MSPERINPERFGSKDGRPTKPSDCYALGMVAYETISGKMPFHKHPDIIVFMKVVEGERPPRGDRFTDGLWGVLERCWEPQPNNRPSIEDVLQCLEMVSNLSGLPSPRSDEGMDRDGDDWDSTANSSDGVTVDSFAADDHSRFSVVDSPIYHRPPVGLYPPPFRVEVPVLTSLSSGSSYDEPRWPAPSVSNSGAGSPGGFGPYVLRSPYLSGS